MGATAAVTAINIGGAALEADSINAQASYANKVIESNQRLNEYKADFAVKRGRAAANNFRKQVKQTKASQRVALAAQGVDVNTADAIDIQRETDEMGAMDALTIENNAWLEAFGYKFENTNLEAQKAFNKIGAKQQATATLINGGMKSLSTAIKEVPRSKKDPNQLSQSEADRIELYSSNQTKRRGY